MAQPTKVVFFMGAGFSKAWGLPVMNEFFDHAEATDRLGEDDKSFLRLVRSRAGLGNRMLDGSIDNLEHILSFAMMADGVRSLELRPKAPAAERMRLILQRVYSEIRTDRWNDLAEAFKGMVGAWGRDPSISFITTNYDLLIEFLLSRFGRSVSIETTWNRQAGTTAGMYSEGGSHRLCKLHGSLNWYESPHAGDHFVVEDGVLSGTRFTDAGPKPVELPSICFDKYSPPGPPLIVPPTLFKMQFDQRFAKIWSSAGKALADANVLVFVGYSFPESDTHMKYFLASSLYDNFGIKNRGIIIVAPDAQRIVSRLDASDFGSHFKQLVRAIEAKWEEVKWEDLKL